MRPPPPVPARTVPSSSTASERTIGSGGAPSSTATLPDRFEFAEAWFGCLRAGAVYVPIKTAYTQSEVAYFLDDAAHFDL